MDKDLHTINEIFNEAYGKYEDEPSSAAWEKINARLDKEDADKYKKGFIGWKRGAILLLFLLGALVIYESRTIMKGVKGNGFAEKVNSKGPVSAKIQKTTDDAAIENNSKPEQPKQKTAGSITEQPATKQRETIEPIESELKGKNVTANKKELLFPRLNKEEYNKNNKTPHQKKLVAFKNKMIITGRDENILSPVKNKFIGTGIDNDPLMDETRVTEIRQQRTLTAASMKRIPSPEIVPINIALQKIRMTLPLGLMIAESPVEIIRISPKHFKPYWTLTAFASSDWSQYQLDNDLQNNNGNNQDEKVEINKREKHDASFSAGLLATRQLKKNWGFKTGLIYSNTAIMIDPQLMYASQRADGKIAFKYVTSSGYGYVKPDFGSPPVMGDSLQSAKAQHNLKVLSVPLLITYRFDLHKIS